MSPITAATKAGPGAESLLSKQQLRSVKRLPAGHEFVGVLGRTPILRRPDGRLTPMRAGLGDAKTDAIQASQGYLLVNG